MMVCVINNNYSSYFIKPLLIGKEDKIQLIPRMMVSGRDFIGQYACQNKFKRIDSLLNNFSQFVYV